MLLRLTVYNPSSETYAGQGQVSKGSRSLQLGEAKWPQCGPKQEERIYKRAIGWSNANLPSK